MSNKRRVKPRAVARAVRDEALRRAHLEEEVYQPSPAAQARLAELRQLPAVDDDGLTEDDRRWIDEQLAAVYEPDPYDLDPHDLPAPAGMNQARRRAAAYVPDPSDLPAQAGMNRAQRRAAARGAGRPALDATVEWGGRRWSVHLEQGDVSVELMEAFEEGKTATALRELLGPAQWAAFKAMQPGMTGLTEMFEALAEELGFLDAGESSASRR